MRILYNKVFSKIQSINFEELYTGFHPFRFALYNDNRIWFEDRDIPQEGFFGNTAKEYNGEYIAIWKVNCDIATIDIDELTAGIVHEMFHAFQLETDMNDMAPNDLKLLMYPINEDNLYVKQNENELIAESVDATPERKAIILRTVRASREFRKGQIGEYLDQEDLIERWEGQAECCGLLALKAMNPNKYFQKLHEYADYLRNSKNLLDVRRNAYYSGSLLRILEREVDEKLNPIKSYLNSDYLKKREIIDDFYKKDLINIEAKGYICGYDPMNQFRLNDIIYATNFMDVNVNGNIIRLSYPVAVKMKPSSPNEILGWSTLK